ncbi:GNAT family N-acetyltransferase [Altererythrobacter soli]|uniref:GNAT family N-acetyltransferase n=1 Tax=Croceibacterium soli TaxID=1739690 RepID=A0A6I4UVP5_9SPHN|nr:GNAT family N-acetyltransferase [Croceibacterium soli]MXP41859.1 GNAT family N-acetyltransferase [Croceibacterium soli]
MMHPKRLSWNDLGWASNILADAFHGRPPGSELFREPNSSAKLRYFWDRTCRYALLFGECYGSEDGSGVALWLLPNGTAMTPWRMFRSGMFTAPFYMGMRDFKAFVAFAQHTDAMHREALPEAHYYLFALGVRADKQGCGVGSSLTRAMLGRAKSEGVPVFLETQTTENVRLYERLGFEVVSEVPIPGVQLRNWAMVKR